MSAYMHHAYEGILIAVVAFIINFAGVFFLALVVTQAISF